MKKDKNNNDILILGGIAALGAGYFLLKGKGDGDGLHPGSALVAKITFRYQGAAASYSFYAGIGKGATKETFVPVAEWSSTKPVEASLDRKSLRSVTLDLTLPEDMILGTYTGMAQVYSGSRLMVTAFNAKAIIVTQGGL